MQKLCIEIWSIFSPNKYKFTHFPNLKVWNWYFKRSWSLTDVLKCKHFFSHSHFVGRHGGVSYLNSFSDFPRRSRTSHWVVKASWGGIPYRITAFRKAFLCRELKPNTWKTDRVSVFIHRTKNITIFLNRGNLLSLPERGIKDRRELSGSPRCFLPPWPAGGAAVCLYRSSGPSCSACESWLQRGNRWLYR